MRRCEKEIKKIIEETLSKYKLKVHPDAEEENRTPKVLIGFVPQEDLETLIPCVAFRAVKGQNTITGKNTSLKIGVAIYDDESDKGYETLSNIIEDIGKSIIEKGIILDEFEILPSYTWNLIEEAMYPFWAGEIIIEIVSRNSYRTDLDSFINGGSF